MALHERLKLDMQAALKSGDKERLGVLRMALATIQQREVDTREPLDDDAVQRVIEKLIKQGRDSLEQYRQGGRDDLAEREAREVEILSSYLPEPLGEAEVEALVGEAIAETGAADPGDMGRVMAAIRAKAAGRVDMKDVSARVQARLRGG